jgi:hypothetical protein
LQQKKTEFIKENSDRLMKRTILLALLVSVFIAACGSAASDDLVEVEETSSIVTVFRSPT